MRILRYRGNSDYILLSIIIILIIFGLIFLASVSSPLGKNEFNDSYYYLKRQILYGFLPGLIGFIITYLFFSEKYKKFALFFLILNIFLLVLVKFSPLGVKAGGASRWLTIGPITFQPSEILKITYILYIAAWLSNIRAKRTTDITYGFLPFLFISGIMGFLLYIQPSTTIIIILLSTGFILYLISGIRFKYIFLTILICGLIFSISIFFDQGYRLQRIKSFWNNNLDIYGSGYHSYQAMITIGSGGWFGFGFGKSTTKTTTLPESLSDSIFAVIAQELGFVGSGLLIFLLSALVFRLFYLALKAKDKFRQLVLVGFGLIIGIQSIIHISVLIGFFPITGIPLPFISYGGTSLAVFMTMTGIALNISRKY